jgi:hypothetical protein
MFIAGAIVGGIASSLISGNAAKKAANVQAQSAAEANALQKYMYDTTRSDNEPWRQAGQDSLSRLMSILNSGKYSTAEFTPQDLQNDPGYQFQLSEGMKSVNNSASARGGIGGAALKAGARYTTGLADTTYNNAFQRFQTERNNTIDPLYRLAGLGSNVNTQNAVAGSNYATQAGNNMLFAGQAQADAGVERGNIYGNMLNQGIATYNRRNPPSMLYPELGTNPYGTGYQYDSPFDLYPGP